MYEEIDICVCCTAVHVLSIKLFKNFNKNDGNWQYNINVHNYNINGIDSDGMRFEKVGNFEKCTLKILLEWLY